MAHTIAHIYRFLRLVVATTIFLNTGIFVVSQSRSSNINELLITKWRMVNCDMNAYEYVLMLMWLLVTGTMTENCQFTYVKLLVSFCAQLLMLQL